MTGTHGDKIPTKDTILAELNLLINWSGCWLWEERRSQSELDFCERPACFAFIPVRARVFCGCCLTMFYRYGLHKGVPWKLATQSAWLDVKRPNRRPTAKSNPMRSNSQLNLSRGSDRLRSGEVWTSRWEPIAQRFQTTYLTLNRDNCVFRFCL